MAAATRAQDAVPLATGFTPDPIWLDGRTHAERALSEIAPGCAGFVGAQPDRVLTLETRFLFLRFFALSEGPVTLALRGPDGHWHCNGHPLENAPREQGRFERGRYEVWVGSAAQGHPLDYRLALTEMRTVGPSLGQAQQPGQTGLDAGLNVAAQQGRFRDRRLRRGFLPDPLIDSGQGGGSLSTAALGGHCRTFTAPEPNHVLVLRDEFDYLRVHLRAMEAPLVLIVRTPDGRYLCSSPDQGLPTVDQERWPTGSYLVWVGARDAQATPGYEIVYTETRD